MKKILVTGGNGRFASRLKEKKLNFNFIFLNKKQLNILNPNSINSQIKKYKPDYVLHLAGLTRPMDQHEKDIEKSINLNIVGTSNLVIACKKFNVKIIYFSTNYIYPGTKGNYKETDPVLPWNNYGWSKLGAESAVQMYKNSLILRVCMTEKPFVHKKAYANVKSNFIYHDELINKLSKIINFRGIYNLGGKSQTIYSFAYKENKKIKKIYSKGEFPLRLDMNFNRLNRDIRKK